MKNHWLKVREEKEFFENTFLVEYAYSTCGTEHFFTDYVTSKTDDDLKETVCFTDCSFNFCYTTWSF